MNTEGLGKGWKGENNLPKNTQLEGDELKLKHQGLRPLRPRALKSERPAFGADSPLTSYVTFNLSEPLLPRL